MRFSAPTILRPMAAVKLKPDGEVDEDGEDDAGLFQRQPQNQENNENRHDAVERGAVGDRGEFLIRKGHRSREAHSDALVRRQAQLRNSRPDGLGRLASGLKIVVIEDGLDIDEPPKLRRLRRAPRDQPAPGEGGMLSLCDEIQGVADSGDRRPQIFERRFFEAHALERLRDVAKDAAQRRIGGERPEEGLGLDQLGHVAPHLVDGLEEDPVAGEELRRRAG